MSLFVYEVAKEYRNTTPHCSSKAILDELLFPQDFRVIIRESPNDVDDAYLCKYGDSEEFEFKMVERMHFETFNEI